MFFQFDAGGVKEIPPEKLDRGILTAGYLSVDELVSLTDSLGFEPSTAEECRVPEKYFRSGVEVYDDHTFTQLRIVGRADEDEDCVALYIGNITKKAERLREDADSLKSSVEHLQEAYSSFLDSKMNSTMKVFTVLTSIFFRLPSSWDGTE